jgi:multidrug resistance efflux pump
MRARWWIVTVIAVAAVGGVLALRRKPAPVAPARQAAKVVEESPGVFTVQGKIRPQHVIGVSSPVEGFIEALLADPGQDVYEGQVLARIGAQGLESNREGAQNALERAQEQVGRTDAALASAKLELSRAEADAARSRLNLERVEKVFSRQQTLFREGATPRLTYERAAADYEAARRDYDIMDEAVRTGRERVQSAQKDSDNARKAAADKRDALEEAQDNVAASEVRSPADGYVVARGGEVGKTAQEVGDKLFTIATDLFALEAVVDLKPEYMKRLIAGMPATVNVLDLDNASFQGTVKSVDDKANQVVVEFGSANPNVKPGMVADVRFKVQ